MACDLQIQKIVLYSEDDVHLLDWEQSCWDKEAIISSERVLDHILDMGIRSTWTGCSLNQTPPNHSSGSGSSSNSLSVAADDDLVAAASAQLTAGVDNSVNLTCRGERRYDAPKKVTPFSVWSLAVSEKAALPPPLNLSK